MVEERPIKATPINKDLIQFIEGIDFSAKESYRQELTRSQSDLKLSLNSNKTPVNFSITDWFGNFESFNFLTITVTVLKTIAF